MPHEKKIRPCQAAAEEACNDTIRVTFCTRLFWREKNTFTLELTKGATVNDSLAIALSAAEQEQVLCVIEGVVCTGERVLQHNDCITLFPVLTGG